MSSSRSGSKTQNRTRSSRSVASAIQHKRPTGYDDVLTGMVELLDSARRSAARAVNSVMTATYWEVGRRIVEFEQAGEERARYGANLLERLAVDLTNKVGRGYSRQNLQQMRQFYLAYPPEMIYRTEGGESGSKCQTPSGELTNHPSSGRNQGTARDKNASKLEKTTIVMDSIRRVEILERISSYFRLSWSHYVQLLKVEKPESREFYEAEALRCGWTVRQLERQIMTLFYERTLASRNKAAMLKKGAVPEPDEVLSAEEEIKDPFILEFLDLKDEYSETQLEEALIKQLENFLMELGSDFAFLGRQKRLKIGDEWYRIDLLFYHRRLRCLVIVDLKIGKFTHADAGQMHLYLSYAQEHWTRPEENPPVGLILCTRKDNSVVHYALDTLPNKILAAEYRTNLPDEKTLAAELEKTRRMLDANPTIKGRSK